MTATASSSSKGPRYAPPDPTLPKPWKGLIDGSTGYIYFWNPDTNVTQYERPVVAAAPAARTPPLAKPEQGSFCNQHSEVRSSSLGSNSYPLKASHESSASAVSMQNLKATARGDKPSDTGGDCSIEAYRRQHEITVIGDGVPEPFRTFQSTCFPSEILREVLQAGFSAPTPIQAQSWPITLQGRDIVAVAKTGSGKTLGYLLPGFIHLKQLRNNSKMGPTILVLSPTRELATQIQDEAVKFGRSSRISSVCLYGGAPKGPQLRDLDRGADVVVATPGRLNDILEMRRVSLHQISYLVLDEADRMLDMGFEPQIRKIVKEIPPRRQTLMFTATWPKEVRKIAADLLVSPVQVNIGSVDELVANKAITQYVEVITPTEKHRRLEQILRSQQPGSRVIIFCSTKRMCDQLARTLTRQYSAAAIHGDKSQVERDSVLSQFRSGKSPILVATDVAARGLDVKDIRVVVNYDFPTGVEDYVHRIGRTGRAGATGVAYTFFCAQDSKYASDLVKVLEGACQSVPSQLRDMVSHGGYGGKFRYSRYDARAQDHSYAGGGVRDSGHGQSGDWGPTIDKSYSSDGQGSAHCGSFHDRYYGAHQRNSRDTKSAVGTTDHAVRDSFHSRSLNSTLSNDMGCGDWNNIRRRSRSRSPNGDVHNSPTSHGGEGYGEPAVCMQSQ
ncbi:ATP-dependent RNA helicase-like protein DB10 isoform X1 [Typha latifolia]|uniref:ATP-dependent RNA helicase-like protein DB10 isoform X1 n=1 Tax=Typha latifolia TaxID=4733 RepID=UPI003C2D9557